MTVNLASSESRTINETRNEQEGRKHRIKDGSIDETKYVKGNNLVHLSYVAYPCILRQHGWWGNAQCSYCFIRVGIVCQEDVCTVQLLLHKGGHCMSGRRVHSAVTA